MHISTKELDPYTVEATITLDAGEVQEYLRKGREAISGEVTVQGFRKGKAPAHIAGKEVGDKAVREAALELALSESFTRAATEKGWDIARTDGLKVAKNDDTGLAYEIRVRLWPEVTLADLATVRVPRKAVDVSAQEIDEALDTVLNMRATFLDKTGPAGEGDRVEVDFDASVAGTPVEGGSSRNHPLVIGGKSFMPGFEEQLIGLPAGAEKVFSLAAPADYYEPKIAGKTVDFTVTVRRVQSVLKPAADDAFAQSLGRFRTIGELRDSLRDGIAGEKEGKEQQRLRLAILDAIIAASTVPAPAAMVADELDEMVHRFGHDLRDRGLELGMYLAKLGKTEDQLRKDWQQEAERQVRIMLVLRQTARSNGITVPPEELDAALRDTVAALIRTGQATEDQVDPERIRTALAERILRDKVLEFLEARCTA